MLKNEQCNVVIYNLEKRVQYLYFYTISYQKKQNYLTEKNLKLYDSQMSRLHVFSKIITPLLHFKLKLHENRRLVIIKYIYSMTDPATKHAS